MRTLNKNLLILGIVAIVSMIISYSLIVAYVPSSTDIRVIIWWTWLCTASAINMCLWTLSFLVFRENKMDNQEQYEHRKYYPLLALIYAIVAALRSIFPKADVQRYGLIDHWMSSVAVGRSLATVAEMSFIILLALYLKEGSEDVGSHFGIVAAKVIVPVIAVAEGFSWYSVITTNFIGNAIEESLWGISGALLFVGVVLIYKKAPPDKRKALIPLILLAVGYVIYMFTVDVPLYITNYLADQTAGIRYLSFSEGLTDAATRWIVTFSFADWQPEMSWMALYFSVIVWMTILLVHAPRMKEKNPTEVARTEEIDKQ